jgi:phage terminase large subunit-like protein
MSSRSAVAPPLLGLQVPTFHLVPPARQSAGPDAVELAASAGLTLDPWQELVLEGALGEERDPRRRGKTRWVAPEVGLVVPRQNGKGGILEARELAGLFLFDEQLILHSAHEFKTASEAFRRLLFLIQNTPDLERRVSRVRTSHGDEGIELIGGQRIRFVARSTGSGRGFSGDCIILDEAYNLSAAGMSAMLPTLSARPNPQIWYTSSAPLPRQESDTLRRLCKRGRDGAREAMAA